jgi:hypothetical protein
VRLSIPTKVGDLLGLERVVLGLGLGFFGVNLTVVEEHDILSA